MEQGIQKRTRAVGTGEARPQAGSSVTSSEKPFQTPSGVRSPCPRLLQHPNLSFIQLYTYSCHYYFFTLSLLRYYELLEERAHPRGHTMNNSTPLPLGGQRAARNPDTL